MAQLPWSRWHEVVKLRGDLRSGDLPLHLFTADLYEVMMQNGKRPIYEMPEEFFALSHAQPAGAGARSRPTLNRQMKANVKANETPSFFWQNCERQSSAAWPDPGPCARWEDLAPCPHDWTCVDLEIGAALGVRHGVAEGGLKPRAFCQAGKPNPRGGSSGDRMCIFLVQCERNGAHARFDMAQRDRMGPSINVRNLP
jgi:hypothetical protein